MTDIVVGQEASNWSDVWAVAKVAMRKAVGTGVFDCWIAPLFLEKVIDGVATIVAPTTFTRDYVHGRYIVTIERALVGAGVSSVEIITTEAAPKPAEKPSDAPSAGSLGGRKVPLALKGVSNTPNPVRVPDSTQTFGTFVIGPSNEFAAKAAQRFVEVGETDMDLLFIHGGFGFGKTHLLNAMALEATANGRTALFLRAEDFMRRFLTALRSNETLAFKEELRGFDLLLVDDMQHIGGRTATTNEFLHTINAFADFRRKVVIAADRLPAAIEGLADDVRSRLQAGLTVAIENLDRDTRLAILKAKAASLGRKLPRGIFSERVLELLADELDVSPRELIGMLVKLATYADLTGKPITLEAAKEAVANRINVRVQPITIDEIQKKTAEYYQLDLRELHSARRARRVARPRQVAMYLARELTSRSLPDIGRRFGGRDHTTVLHACRRVEALCKGDSAFQAEVDFLRKTLDHSRVARQ